jgi:hypothetical protein
MIAAMDTTALDALLTRIPTRDHETVRVLHAAWQSGDPDVRRMAWVHGKEELTRRGLGPTYEQARDRIRRWVSDFATGRTAVPDALDRSFGDQDRLDLRIAATPALLDAALGTLVGDALDEAERDELLAPWLEATGRPAPVGDTWAFAEDPGSEGTASTP